MRLSNFIVLASFASLATSCGTGGSSAQAPAGTPPTIAPGPSGSPASSAIQHVVIIFQENRTPDNLFQGLPGADIASSGLTSSGRTIPLQPIPLADTYDIDHSHTGFLRMYDGGKMDGADTLAVTCGNLCPYTNPQYGYAPADEVAPYMQMATRYAFGDRMFQTNEGPSYPAHQYILSGTSQPSAGSNLLVSENTLQPGCGPTGGSLVRVIDPSGSENQLVASCFEHPTLPDLLDAKSVSWRYYVPSLVNEGLPGIWIAPNSIGHLRFGTAWGKVIAPETTILADIANRTLRQVSWVIPSTAASDHPVANNGTGPSWVAAVVNAIGQSAYWKNTAIFVVWDDWGGWYDHVKPPILGPYELGFRVPLIVISPYVKPGYVSHVQHEFGSILKFTEEAFGTGSLGYTDARADDLNDFFNFQQPPLAYTPLQARFSASYFARLPPDTRSVDTDF